MTHSQAFVRHLVTTGLLFAAMWLTGCAQITVGAPVASVDNIQRAKQSGMAPVSVGNFTLASGKPAAIDGPLNIRSNSVAAPTDRSYAKYLKETLAIELRSAGLLVDGAPVVIRGELTDSMVDAGIGTGRGAVAARFMVDRAGRTVYDKELRAAGTWESSFVGATAIPAAINEYTALHRKLVAQLLDDADFRKAVAR